MTINIALPLPIMFRMPENFWKLDLNTSVAIKMRCFSKNENEYELIT